MNVCGLARHCCDLLVAVGIGDTAVAAALLCLQFYRRRYSECPIRLLSLIGRKQVRGREPVRKGHRHRGFKEAVEANQAIWH